MQKITLSFKGKGSITLNVHGYESIEIKEGKNKVFNSATEYRPYAKIAGQWKDEGVLEISVVDSAEAVAPVAPAKKAEKVDPPAAPAVKVEEVKTEVAPVAPVATAEVKEEVKAKK